MKEIKNPEVIASTTEEAPALNPLGTAEEFEKLREIEAFLKEHNVYIHSSIEGKGVYVGRFNAIFLDADGFPVIECDIDSVSCTDECYGAGSEACLNHCGKC